MQFIFRNNGEFGRKNICRASIRKNKTPSPNAILPEVNENKNVCVVPHVYVLIFPKRKISIEVCVYVQNPQSLSGIHHYSPRESFSWMLVMR